MLFRSKALNGGKQMRSDWEIPLCTGAERLRINGEKAHSTQKPEALLYRVILSSSNPGDVVLDPFFGTGTTGAVARKLHRHWIGIEKNEAYVRLAEERIAAIQPEPYSVEAFEFPDPRRLPRVPFRQIVEMGLLQPGQRLLDLGAGTGDLAFEALRRHPGVQVVAADFTPAMLQVGRKRPEPHPGWAAADALRLPFPDESFDALVSGFLLRNVADLDQALAEQYRVLRPGGRWV